jgi:putative two-component system response regulator
VSENIDILVIDDNEMQLEYLTDLFARHGLTVFTLNDSTKAIDTMLKRTPKLVLLDLMMPQLDGFTLLKRLKENKALAGIPVIIYTGKLYPIDEKKAQKLGATSYLVKPVKGSVLVDEVKKYI